MRHSSTHLATGPDRATGAAVVLLLLYIPFGLFGREPWKADEAYSFGIVYSMLVDQQWLVPTLAGEPFIEKPPVMYLLAAAFAKLTHHWLPLHEGARLAVVAMLFGTAYCIARAARSIGGQRAVPMALVALVSCVGLTVHARMMITDLAVLAGYAMAYLGLTYAIQQRPRAALWLGVGTGLGFLAKGFFAPALIGMTALFLPASVHAVRQNFASYCWVLVRSLIWMSPFFLLWPSLLFMYAPELFHQWFWDNNIGRFTGSSVDRLGASGDLAFVARTLAWYCFPVIPLALIYEIRHRAHQRRHSPDRVPLSDSDGLALTSVLVTVAVLSLSASARVNYFMPLAVPACVWAACVLSRDSPMASQDTWLKATAAIVFIPLMAAVWLTWGYGVWNGVPPDIKVLTKHLPASFVFTFHGHQALMAVGLCGAGVWLARLNPLPHARGLWRWAIGLTCWWGVLNVLLLPWVDSARGYRATFEAMVRVLPSGYDCVSSRGLGESERGVLHYYTGIKTVRSEVDKNANVACAVRIVQGTVKNVPMELVDQSWDLRWQGARPGDTRERFWLFQKTQLQ